MTLERRQDNRVNEGETAESRYQRTFVDLVEQAPFGIYVVDSQFRIALMNLASQNGAFRNAHPVIGRDFAEAMRILWPESVAVGVINAFRHTLDTGERYQSTDFINPRNDIETIEAYEWELHRVTLPNGQYGVICYYFDSSKLRQAEAALRKSEEQNEFFARMVRNSSQPIASGYPDGRLGMLNRAFEELTGYTAEELRSTSWKTITPAEWLPLELAKLDELRRTGVPIRYEKEYLRKDGTRVPIELLVHMVADSKGDPAYYYSFLTDISERKRVESALRVAKLSAEQAKGRAERASKAKDHFLAVLSHELRNPLNPVLVTATMLRDDPRFDADARQQLDVICRNVELEARLIDDLLDITRIERGKIELDLQPVELSMVIRRAVEVCQADIEACQLRVRIDMADGPYGVEGDAARLQQVFWNLLKNAVKFTPKGGSVEIRCQRDSNGFVMAEMTDSGEGLEPEALERIFNAFEQAERSTTQRFGGLGLGLAICKAIVELHGGRIAAHSLGKGKGATFTVHLPLKLARSPGVETLPAAGAQQRITPGQSMHILLVEDHGDTARVMHRLLSAKGHTVEHASNVATAIALSEAKRFDLVLSDLGLPDGSGLELIRALRSKGNLLPAIALSGYGQESDVQRSLESGFVAHLAKPVSLPKLEEAIAKAAVAGRV